MKKYQKFTEPAGGQMTLFSQAGSREDESLASHSHKRGSEMERQMTATSGRKCLESLEKFSHVSLWAKMLAASLIGTGEWYSNKCRLTWKLRGMNRRRLYFQLAVSTLPTEGTGFGLLLTPTVTQIGISENRIEKRTAYRQSVGRQYTPGNLLEQIQGMLPTPAAVDSKQTTLCESQRDRSSLPGLMVKMFLPDYFAQTGHSSQLNPLFVTEMMGYPLNWLTSPFQNGDKKALKH